MRHQSAALTGTEGPESPIGQSHRTVQQFGVVEKVSDSSSIALEMVGGHVAKQPCISAEVFVRCPGLWRKFALHVRSPFSSVRSLFS